MVVEFRVLGALEIIRDGVGRSVPSRRQRALIVRLLLGRGQVVPTDALIDAVWEDEPPRDARHAVHTLVSRVRALLGPVLETRAPGYRLAVPAGAVDAERFETGLTAAAGLTDGDPAGAVARFDELLGLWRGPAYAEFAGSFAQAAAVRLGELWLTAREERAEALLAAGGLDRAAGELGELVAEQPLRERPHGQLMRALYRAGRQTDALAVYQDFRERVRDELGLDPSPALRQVHEQVLRQAVPEPATVPSPQPVRAPVTSFVGRGAELRRLAELAGGGGRRIVTLVGPGGVGKTRLARELFSRLPSGRTGWWVDLVPAREPADLPYRFLDALGLPEPAEGDIERFLVDELRTAQAMLVVDNCEHVIAPAALMLARIAAGCPGVVALATSRERLAVDGEQVMTLGPLPESEPESALEPAVALFADRYRAAGGPDLSTEDVTLAAEVCRRVDRLPLAIELAAARAASLGVAAVAARPTLDLLTGGRRTDQPRHRSLRAVLDWSHDLLGSAERVLFRRLAGFRGAFTLDDAEAVCAGGTLAPAQVGEALAGLVDKSMVAGPDRLGRCRLLEAMRAYASEQLAGHGEDRWLGAAHARHFVRFAEQAREGLLSPREREWAAMVAERVDELRAAHRWACAHAASERSSEASDAVGVAASERSSEASDAVGVTTDLALRLAVALADYASYRARFELQEWAETAAALPAAAGHPLRAEALGSAAAGAWARGDFGRAEKLARRGLAAAPAGDPRLAGPVMVLGDLAAAEGRFGDAVTAYREVVAFGEAAGPYLACEARGGLAIVASHRGDPAEAVRLTGAAQLAADHRGAPALMAMSRYFAGEARMTSDPTAALALLAEARALATGVGAWFVAGIATLSEVSLRGRTGADPAAALAAYREAIEHWRRVGNRTQQWVTLRNLIPLLVRAGHDELACVLDGALASAPVRLPADVPVPEAEALAAAVARACARLGDQPAGAARERGARAGFDELVAAVLAVIEDQAGSSR
jgi:predicted ATPase/DNA-binding SARP family transcriptional activator